MGSGTEFFIARRISRRKDGSERNIMVRIATFTVAVSIAVMIVALAVIAGFRSSLTANISGLTSDIEITTRDGALSPDSPPLVRDRALAARLGATGSVRQIDAYAIKGGMVKTDQVIQGVLMKGVDPSYDWSFFAGKLTAGQLPTLTDTARSKDVLISSKLASLLMVSPGDRLEMLFRQADALPGRDIYRVSGLYDTGFEELDLTMVLTDIRNIQKLNGWGPDMITGYDIMVAPGSNTATVADRIDDILMEISLSGGQSLTTRTLEERFPNLFDWLRAHNVNAAVIILIMLLVSLLTMICALLIIVLERTRMTGILKSLGMNNRSLQAIFVMRCGFIIVKGLIWGNIVGIGLCLLQKYTGLIKLDSSGYYLSQVPAELSLWWLAALNAGTVLILLSLLALPTMIISRMSPAETLRFQ